MLAKFKEFVNLAETGMKVKQLSLVNQTVKNLGRTKAANTYQIILKSFVTIVEFNMNQLFLTLNNRTE